MRIQTPQLPKEQSTQGKQHGFDLKTVSTTWYILAAVIVLLVVFTVLGPGVRFVSVENLQSLARNSSQFMLLGIGLTYILGAGNIDLSVGSTLVLSSVVGSKTLLWVTGGQEQASLGNYKNLPLAFIIAIITAIAVGAVAGWINGLLVTKFKIHSFVVTLGTMGVYLGISQVITNGSNVPYLPRELQTSFGFKNVIGIPVPIAVAIIIGIIAAFMLTNTTFGRHTLAVGSDLEGARRAGVNVNRTVVRGFVFTGALCGIAGFIDITRFATTAVSGHEMDILTALSAVIIGGTSLFGGRASVLSTMFATFIPTILLSGFVILGFGSFYQEIAIGAVLIIAVGIDRLRQHPANFAS